MTKQKQPGKERDPAAARRDQTSPSTLLLFRSQLSSADVVHAASAFLAMPESEGDDWKARFYAALDVLNPDSQKRFTEGVEKAQKQLGYIISELQTALNADKAEKKRVSHVGRGDQKNERDEDAEVERDGEI